MKNIITILLCTITIFNCTSQNKVTFQDKLSDYISKKKYLSNGYASVEYSNKSGIYAIFWHRKNKKSYLIFAKDEDIYFVLDCGLLPIEEKYIGEITLLTENEFDKVKNLDYSYVTENIMYNYPENEKVYIEDFSNIKKYHTYEKCVTIDDAFFIPIEVELEIPVVFLKVDDTLIMAPFER